MTGRRNRMEKLARHHRGDEAGGDGEGVVGDAKGVGHPKIHFVRRGPVYGHRVGAVVVEVAGEHVKSCGAEGEAAHGVTVVKVAGGGIEDVHSGCVRVEHTD